MQELGDRKKRLRLLKEQQSAGPEQTLTRGGYQPLAELEQAW